MQRLVVAVLTVALLAACRSVGPGLGTDPTPSASPTRTASPSPTPATSPGSTPVPAPTASPVPSTTPQPTPASSAPPSLEHRVAAGESLSAVAHRYGTTWQSLVYWNRDRYPSLDPEDATYDPNRIEAGWQLVVWPGVVVPFDATPVAHRPPASGPSTVVYHGDRASRRIALTFDVGDPVDPFVSITRWLVEHRVPATVFIAGRIVDSTRTDAGRRVLAIMEQHPDLLELASHGYLHPDMREWEVDQITADLLETERAVARHSSLTPRPAFRPPSGYLDADVLAAAGSLGYRYTVLWDVDPLDWKSTELGGPSASEIVSRVVSKSQGGSIVLLHVGRWETLEALPGIVDALRGAGYDLVTLRELLGY